MIVSPDLHKRIRRSIFIFRAGGGFLSFSLLFLLSAPFVWRAIPPQR
jgi:hypothetical protein